MYTGRCELHAIAPLQLDCDQVRAVIHGSCNRLLRALVACCYPSVLLCKNYIFFI
jgi:hypothetical protein